jgi:hypothetical protein
LQSQQPWRYTVPYKIHCLLQGRCGQIRDRFKNVPVLQMQARKFQ